MREELRRVRDNERVLAEQVAYLEQVAADAQRDNVVDGTPSSGRELRAACSDRDRHRALLEEARRDAMRLVGEQDAILDRLVEDDAASRRRDEQ